jgi:hypothetical protein
VKTISLKKVSAVAVASLGFGLLSVVPVNAEIVAGDVVATEVVSTAVGTSSPASNIQISSDAVIADNATTVDIVVELTSKPTGSTVTYDDADGTGGASTDIFVVGGVYDAASDSSGTYTLTKNAATAGATTNDLAGTVSLKPDVPGVYVVTVTARNLADSADIDAETYTVYAGYSVDAAKPNTAFMTQGASISNSASAIAGGVATVRVTNFADTATDDYYTVVVSGGTLTSVTATDDVQVSAAGAGGFNLSNGTNLSGGINFWMDSTGDVSDYVDLQVTSATAGNVTITVTGFNSVTGIGTVHSTPVVAFGTALSTSASASTSKIYVIDTHNTEALSTSTAPGNIARAAGTDAAAFTIIVNDGYGNPINAQSVSAVVTGPGLINGSGAANTASGTPAARVVATTTNSDGKASFNLDADGTAGVSTVTFSAGSTVLGSKTVTFYGAAVKYVATTNVNAVAGTNTLDAVNVSATDALGIAVPGETIYAFSSDATVATVEASVATESSVITEDQPGAAASFRSAKAIGTAGFNVSPAATTTASSVTITFGNAATLAASTVTTTAVVGIGKIEAATVTLTANKTSYAPGEAVTLTLTYRDSLGRLTGTNVGTTLVGSSATSVALGGATLPSATAQNVVTKLGTKTYAVFAPLTGGPVTVTITSGTDATHLATDARSVASAVTFNVTDPTAAIATSIASLNAKIVALNALIAKIMKRLNIR